MTFVEIFGVACTPLVVFGVLLLGSAAFFRIKFHTAPRLWPIWIPMAFIGIPIGLMAFVYRDETTAMVVNQSILGMLLYLLLISVPWVALRAFDQDMGKWLGRIFAIACPPLGLLLLWFAMQEFVGDFLSPRQFTEGTVRKKSIKPVTYSGKGKQSPVEIGGVDFRATGEVYEAVGPGQCVRVEIGSGSRTIFRVQQSPHPVCLDLPRDRI